MRKFSYLALTLLIFCIQLSAQQEIKLYKNSTPESNDIKEKESVIQNDFVRDISEPRMYYYAASKEKINGTAVLICPGGGYSGVSVLKEGEDIAKWFNALGVSAFVLYYRIPNGHFNIPLEDAQTALLIIHERAKEWKIKKHKIGIMGFSAGGHLASTVGTHFKSKIQRPDFMILAYPVITMNKELTHLGSRNNLLGLNPSDDLVTQFSNELQVTGKTPPTFIVHAIDDTTVPIANSEQFLQALLNHHIPAELHKYDVGGHGFGMRKTGIPADNWPELLKNWLHSRGLITK
jgi:acetyl esterase/lipase